MNILIYYTGGNSLNFHITYDGVDVICNNSGIAIIHGYTPCVNPVKNNCTILFIRKASAPKKPFYTVEIKHGDIVQARIQNNDDPPELWKENVLYAPVLDKAA